MRPTPLAIMLLLTGCAGSIAPVERDPPVQHVVVMWLKNPGDAYARRELIDAAKTFQTEIPGIIRVSAGSMLPSTRPAVDSSYDVAVVMTFRDAASLIAYQTHPKHLEAVEKTLKPLVARYVVYDFID